MAKTSQIAQKIASVRNAGEIHDWPEDAGECSAQSWSLFVKNQEYRAFGDWTNPDIFELARLTRMQVAAIDLQERLDDEGYIIMGGKSGNVPVENPVGRALSTLNGSINAVSRRLGLTSMSVEDKRSRANRGKQERDAETIESKSADDRYRHLM